MILDIAYYMGKIVKIKRNHFIELEILNKDILKEKSATAHQTAIGIILEHRLLYASQSLPDTSGLVID